MTSSFFTFLKQNYYSIIAWKMILQVALIFSKSHAHYCNPSKHRSIVAFLTSKFNNKPISRSVHDSHKNSLNNFSSLHSNLDSNSNNDRNPPPTPDEYNTKQPINSSSGTNSQSPPSYMYKSRLDELYDEMFGSDENDDTTAQSPSSFSPKLIPTYPDNEVWNNFNKKNDNTPTKSRNNTSGDKKMIDNKVSIKTSISSNQSQQQNYNNSSSSYKFVKKVQQNDSQILENKRTLKRRQLPSTLEYDYSHYDDEFGPPRVEESKYYDYNPFMDDNNNNDDKNNKVLNNSQRQKLPMDKNPGPQTAHQSNDGKQQYNYERIPPSNYKNEMREPSVKVKTETLMGTNPSFNSSQKLFNDSSKYPNNVSDNNINNSNKTPYSNIQNQQPTQNISPNYGAINENIASNSNPSERSFSSLENMAKPNPIVSFLVKEAKSNGYGSTDNEIAVLKLQIDEIKNEAFSLNKNKPFNLNSPSQVSKILYGMEGESTDKDTLEALASSRTYRNNNNEESNVNIAEMASLVLKYRTLVRTLKRVEKAQEESKSHTNMNTRYSNVINNEKTANNNSDTNGYRNWKQNNPNTDRYTQLSTNRDPILLVDASSYIFRAYYSMPPLHRSEDGMPVGAVLGFCSMLNRIVLNRMLNGERPRLVLIFDPKDSSSNFRRLLYPDYKANRKPCPEDLIPQFDLVKDAAQAYGIECVEIDGFEADDVIATLATTARSNGLHVNILSGDKDLMQLIVDEDVDGGSSIHMLDPASSKRITSQSVIEKWGVSAEKLGDLLALAGDTSDNIPGVPGIGPKIAAELINSFGSLEAILQNVHQIKQKARKEKLQNNMELARLSRKLVDLERNISAEKFSIPLDRLHDLRMESFDSDRLLSFYKTMGFRDLENKVRQRIRTYSKYSSPQSASFIKKEQNMQSSFGVGITSSSIAYTETSNEKRDELNDFYNKKEIMKRETDLETTTTSVNPSTSEVTKTENTTDNIVSIQSRAEEFSYMTIKQTPPKPSDYDDIPF